MNMLIFVFLCFFTIDILSSQIQSSQVIREDSNRISIIQQRKINTSLKLICKKLCLAKNTIQIKECFEKIQKLLQAQIFEQCFWIKKAKILINLAIYKKNANITLQKEICWVILSLMCSDHTYIPEQQRLSQAHAVNKVQFLYKIMLRNCIV